MQNELKEKLENLSEKFNADLDVISLKALCQVPENEQILFAITGTLQRLVDKYPDDEEILGLLPKKEKISLDDLIKLLEEKYSNNVEVITIKALSALPEGENKENAVKQCLERLLEENSTDENILEYLEIEEPIVKEQNPDMVFVKGGSYTPSFFDEERKVFDLYVNKYMVTDINTSEILGEDHNCFYGIFGIKTLSYSKKPQIFDWIYALEYCNKLSEKYGLKPVYLIENYKFIGILQLDGKTVLPDEADFEKTEGYRIPTELEWEWFAFGGQEAIKNGTFSTFSSEKLNDMAWGKESEQRELLGHEVGLKKPNELGLYDVFGNVCEKVYDTCTNGYLKEDKPYCYKNSETRHVLRGGNDITEIRKMPYFRGYRSCGPMGMSREDMNYAKQGFSVCFGTQGLRVVRTAKPKK